MDIDYWQKFLLSGSVQDYLAYRNSIQNAVLTGNKNGQSDDKDNRHSDKGNQNKRK